MSDFILRRAETPSEFAARMGIPLKTFSRKVRHPKCPQNFVADEGRTGRFLRLRASPELEAFMSCNPRSWPPDDSRFSIHDSRRASPP